MPRKSLNLKQKLDLQQHNVEHRSGKTWQLSTMCVDHCAREKHPIALIQAVAKVIEMLK